MIKLVIQAIVLIDYIIVAISWVGIPIGDVLEKYFNVHFSDKFINVHAKIVIFSTSLLIIILVTSLFVPSR